MSENINVNFSSDAPLEYHKRVNEMISDRGSSELSMQELNTYEERKWKEITGVEPKDSSFLLVIPVSNNEDTIKQTLMSVMLSLLPNSVDCTILLMLNNSDDKSRLVIKEFLSQFGTVDRVSLSNLQYEAEEVALDNKTILITSTNKGKVRALNEANKYALSENYEICIALDADVFPSPEAIANLFGECHKTYTKTNEYPVMSGKYNADIKPGKFRNILKKLTSKDQKYISGWMFGWNPTYISEIGGIPVSKIEDYSLSKIVENEDGFDIIEKSEVFGYFSNNPLKWLKIYKRYSMGLLQLLDKYSQKYPNLKVEVEKDYIYLQSADKFFDSIIDSINNRRFGDFVGHAMTLIQKIILIAAKYEYSVESNDTSWKS